MADEEGDEGPFGDHTGYYNSVERFPVFRVSAVTMRREPIYLSTFTGRPPDEPSVLGEALNEVFIPLLQQQFPEIVDFWLPPEGCSYRIAVVSIRKAYAGHAKRIMMGVWSYLRQFMYTKWVIVVDDDIDCRDWKDVMWAISTRMDPARDTVTIENTPIDYLDFASPVSGLGSKAGLDATNQVARGDRPRMGPQDRGPGPMNDAPNDASPGRMPTLDRIEATRAAIAPWVVETPVLDWSGVAKDALLGAGTRVVLKLELLQRTGSFKPRGALANILALDAAQRAAGVTAVSAGNHAIAVAYAARALGSHAKAVMHRAANPFRVAQCRELGAEVVLAQDIHAAFAEMARIRDEEGRAVIHPFEGPDTISGTATLGLEFARQAPDLDAVVAPVGGGGLIAGVATGFRPRRLEGGDLRRRAGRGLRHARQPCPGRAAR